MDLINIRNDLKRKEYLIFPMFLFFLILNDL